jgi:hypothetical protein
METQDLINYRLISDPNKLTLFLPIKMAKAVEYIEESHLRAIHDDLATAKEFVLYFLSFLSITLFDESVTEVNLSTKILKKLLYPVNYLKVIQACESGTPEKGPFIERGKSYSSGIRSKVHKLTATYSKCRSFEYILKNELVKKVYLRNRTSSLEKEMGNPIVQNLLQFYSNPNFELPDKNYLIQRGRERVNEGFRTKKGKLLL